MAVRRACRGRAVQACRVAQVPDKSVGRAADRQVAASSEAAVGRRDAEPRVVRARFEPVVAAGVWPPCPVARARWAALADVRRRYQGRRRGRPSVDAWASARPASSWKPEDVAASAGAEAKAASQARTAAAVVLALKESVQAEGRRAWRVVAEVQARRAWRPQGEEAAALPDGAEQQASASRARPIPPVAEAVAHWATRTVEVV